MITNERSIKNNEIKVLKEIKIVILSERCSHLDLIETRYRL